MGSGGLTTGGTTTGGTTGGAVTVGGTTAGGGTTGGTTTSTGTATVIVTGPDFGGGFGNAPGPVGFDVGGVGGVDGVDGVDGRDGIDLGPAVADGVTEPATVGVGFTEGVGTRAAPCVRCCGTTMRELPPACVGDPKFEPATGGGDEGDTAAFEPIKMTPTVAAVVMPTNEIAATTVLTGVAASAGGSRNAAPSFTAATPP